jgi:peptide chain release factor 1
MEQDDYKPIQVNESEVRIERTRGTGNGGQRKNSTDSCIVMTHIATGIKVVRDGRHQHENKELALQEITKRVNDYYRTGHMSEYADERREQIGSGVRSDKRRTYRVKDGIVTDHVTNKSASLKDIQRGKIILLH